MPQTATKRRSLNPRTAIAALQEFLPPKELWIEIIGEQNVTLHRSPKRIDSHTKYRVQVGAQLGRNVWGRKVLVRQFRSKNEITTLRQAVEKIRQEFEAWKADPNRRNDVQS